MPKFRPIQREIYSDDIAAGFQLAVHARMGYMRGPSVRTNGMSVPNIAGVKVRGALGGGSLSPANAPQSTATGGNQNPPFGSGN